MKITVEHRPGAENEIILRCPALDGEMLDILALLRARDQRLGAWQEDQLLFLAPNDILYAESVDEKTFFYCADAVYPTPLSLAELEIRCGQLGFCRISRTMVANLHRVSALRSLPAARIEATMENREKLIVSRRYAPLLREQLGLESEKE